jgi:membrane-associated protein
MGDSLTEVINWIGYWGVWGIIFAETGIVFGILLPGDMLLFLVGVLCAQGTFDIWLMSIGCFLAAFLGNILGYETGRWLGLPFIKKYGSNFVTEEHLLKTQIFFNKYGRSGIVVARFVPIARTLAPFLAGISRMDYRVFLIYSASGAAVWGGGLPWLGYLLAGRIPHELIDYIILPVVAVIVFIIAGPWLKTQFDRYVMKTKK